MMASRVTLLLLVTGLFAGMWSGDGRENNAAREPLLAHQGAAQAMNSRTTARPGAVAIRSSLRGREEWSAASIPLPRGIAAGTYLVVDGHGRTETRLVTAAEAFPNGRIERHVAADQYAIRLGSDRWHFIRLDDAAETRAARRVVPIRRAGRVRAAGLH